MPFTLSPDEPLRVRGLPSCPECGDTRTLGIRDVDCAVFFCEICGAAWRIELGFVHRVHPSPSEPLDE